ncbi:uncharacterized protein At1g76070-like [Cicer arietinum]|uniref:Uncharacterized protein At1g76070-like n=1 Tax=Cicer arietinum TaxID=3827 RepID=A0A1S2Y6H2_CICAR|nr:uncharacterized protein At1g76070-like [Cicer arietinum]
MEKDKQSKLRNKILKIIPKAAAAITVTFQNGPFSPGRDHKFRSDNNTNRWQKTHFGKGFSGPMIPPEARTKPKGETQEPTSPKISCMGQIKHKKKHHNIAKTLPTHGDNSAASTPKDTEVKKSKFQRMFSHRSKSKFAAKKPDEFVNGAPPMGEMRRFASGRESFANFDWKGMIEAEEINQRECYTDAEEDDEILIPFSAPILGGGNGNVTSNLNLKPRNEINLWKRRTMAPPRPLQLNPVLTAK